MMSIARLILASLMSLCSISLLAKVEVGADRLFTAKYEALVKGKKVGLITNHTGVTSAYESTLALFEGRHAKNFCKLVAIFAPEHGLFGEEQAGDEVASSKTESGIPVYSLFGDTRRPTKQMLENIDTLVYDVQDLGCRSYTYATTLFYVMEEAAKRGIEVVVLDRPNPLGGVVVDGTMLEDGMRSFVGYINVPYCHGMTIGELAQLFNHEYAIGCKITVVPMCGWHREMRFDQTGLPWIPTSPHIPEHSSPFFYPATGPLGQLSMVHIGIGGGLPFKMVAAPWINKELFAKKLNRGGPAGVRFQPTKVKPLFGLFSGKTCNGVLIIVTDWSLFNPVRVQYWIFDGLKQLYPGPVVDALKKAGNRLPLFHKVCGCNRFYDILLKESRPYEKLVALHAKERAEFLKIRQKYLNPQYSSH